MHADWISLSASLGGALFLGLGLAWAVAIRMLRAGVAPVLATIALLPLIPRAYMPATAYDVAIGALLMLATTGPKFLETNLSYGGAARSLGASEWRIFWRVLAPLGWRAILDGLLLVLLVRLVRSLL